MTRSLFLLAPIAVAASALAAGAYAHEVLHAGHEDHAHGADCGHMAIEHAGHVDYLHDGHLHFGHSGHYDEHALAVSSTNPAAEELASVVTTDDHMHGHDGEEHAMVQHGDHMDYIHDGRLHFVHGDHMDDHGPVALVDPARLAAR
ncbi:MAG: hypothetical protein RIB52_07580 [Erythrobacter sp.]|uniref:hypothetical protein n=1 Tax=Erythrobacter sp. TaxID=1042 RepID=UPI0032F021FD